MTSPSQMNWHDFNNTQWFAERFPLHLIPHISPSHLISLPALSCSYGGDLSSECIASGVSDTLGFSMSRCRALCAADPVCAGITYTAISQACTKKCAFGLTFLVRGGPCPSSSR